LSNQIAHKFGVLRGKRNGLPDRAQCCFPRIVKAKVPGDKFAVHFGQVNGADGRNAQRLRRQPFVSGFLIENGE